MPALDDVIKNIKKKYGATVIGSLEETTKEYQKIPLRTASLTYLFRGGLPRTIFEVLGEPSAGKSSCAYMICGCAQKQFKQEWEEEVAQLQAEPKLNAESKARLQYLLDTGYQKVVYLDHEFTSDLKYMRLNGIDTDELIYIRPDGQTAEELFQILLDLMSTGSVGCVVLDSIPALVSAQASSKDMTEKTMAGISASLSTFCQKMLPIQKKYNILFIGINQPREDLMGYHRVLSPGGKMFKHTCSVRLLFKKESFYGTSYEELKAHPENAYGQWCAVEKLKDKSGDSASRRMCKFSITYTKGIDGFFDTVNLGVMLGLIVKAGAWFSVVSEDGELMTDSEGNNMKWQGMKNVIAYFESHEIEFKELAKAVDEAITAED